MTTKVNGSMTEDVTPTKTFAEMKALTGVSVGSRVLVWRNGVPTSFQAEAASSPDEYGRVASTGTAGIDWVVQAGLLGEYNINSFGAVGGIGASNDVPPIRAAIDKANADGIKVVYGQSGNIYGVDTTSNTSGIHMKSNVTLDLTGCTLQALYVSIDYRMIYITGVSNCKLIGGTIIGNRDLPGVGGTGEQGHGIYCILNVYDVDIIGVTSRDHWGDGIYTGRDSAGITIRDCTVHNNRRNNISVAGTSRVTIDGCDIYNANGTSPETGVDFEPNPGATQSDDIKIINSSIHDNAGNGVAFPAPPPLPLITSAIVDNCLIYNNGATGLKASYVEKLIISNNHIKDNGTYGIEDSAALATTLIITGNVVSGNASHGIFGFAGESIISGNTVHDNGGRGIEWRFGQNTTIANNVVFNCAEEGIRYERAYCCSISNNTISQVQKSGILLTGTVTGSTTRSRKCSVMGNTILSAGLLTDNTYYGIHSDVYSNTSTISGNIVAAAATGNQLKYGIYAEDASVYVSNNHTSGSAKAGNAEIVAGGITPASFVPSPSMMSHLYLGKMYTSALTSVHGGAGSPEGAQGSLAGSIYTRSDGPTGKSVYVKDTGASSTGWAAVYAEGKVTTTTTDATLTTAKSIAIPDDTTALVKVRIVAKKSGSTDRAIYEIVAGVYRVGTGAATLLTTPVRVVEQETNAAWNADISISGNNATILVTGVAATTISWDVSHHVDVV